MSTVQCKAPIFLSCTHTSGSIQVQLVVLVRAFVMVSTVWSVFCLLFVYSRCPLCPADCKSVGHVPPGSLWSRRHCSFSPPSYWVSLL